MLALSMFSLSVVLMSIVVANIASSFAGNVFVPSKEQRFFVTAFSTLPSKHHTICSIPIGKCRFSNRPITCSPSTRTADCEVSVSAADASTADTCTTKENSSRQQQLLDAGQDNRLTIVAPNEGFRNTALSGGKEVSIASMNLLAPFYNSLSLPSKTTSDYERWKFLDDDRTQRVPEAIRIAKLTNADVLCLQEIEGGKLGEEGASGGKEFTLRDDVRNWLAESTTISTSDGTNTVVEGYDSFMWSPLNPNNKRGDVVGLCIAWRSQKHSLVEWQGYRRGMVCLLREVQSNDADESTAAFAVANLHLPARPSNVLGRLKTMSKTISKLSDLDKTMQQDRPKLSPGANTIHGLMVVTGDFNSDQDSVVARLLSHGYTNYGNVRDRNYKAKVTKAAASTMSHPYRFIDSYDHGKDYGGTDPRFREKSFRDLYAPVTVSLRGRGPGIMDHLFYTTGKGKKRLLKKPVATKRTNPSQVALRSSEASTKDALTASLLQEHLGSKRRKRRKNGESRGGGGSAGAASAAHHSNNGAGARIRVEAVLATLDTPSTIGSGVAVSNERLAIIREGLPNLEQGFPSDHLPIGVLFSAIDEKSSVGIDSSDSVVSSANQITNEVTTVMKEEEDYTPTNSGANHDFASNATPATSTAADSTQTNNRRGPSGVSSSVLRKRESSKASFGLRRRHNRVLNAVAEWLVGRGASSVILDKPLYKNDLLARILGGAGDLRKSSLTKRSRAPDLMCVVVNNDRGDECLVVVEIAVASDPNKVREQKASKYRDLVELVSDSGKDCRLATIVVRDDGGVPEGTFDDIRLLTKLTSGWNASQEDIETETERLCAHVESLVSSFRILKKDRARR